MKKQMLISFLIVALINFLVGCRDTSAEKIYLEKLTLEKETIQEAILLNLDVVKFNKEGGRFVKNPAQISGKLKNGKNTAVPVDQIKEFRISESKPTKLQDLNDSKIKEVLLTNNIIVTFDENGAQYSKKSEKIWGNTPDKKMVSFQTNQISEYFLELPQTIERDSLNSETQLAQIILKSNNSISTFDKNGGRFYLAKEAIIGFSAWNTHLSVNPDSVLYLFVQRDNVVGTIMASVGILALVIGGAILVVYATKNSCPFVYSFDGEKYVFDAEPLGGATTKGLERTEYSKLEHLKKVNNEYKILVRNEVEETQYIDELSLIAICHDKDKEVVPDLNGNFHQIKNPLTPVIAKDEKGLDLKNAVCVSDNLCWQTKLPIDSNLISKSIRHELTFTFAKPHNKTKAKLIANIGTSLWGSRMIKEMLQLYGNYVDTYYQKIDEQGGEYKQMMSFIEKEELYKLKYYTKNGDTWKPQGFINGGGPLISETRVYDLDLSDIKGDSVTIKINPPYGYWTVDYMAIEYEDYAPAIIEPMLIKTAIDQSGAELKELISSKDSRYSIMPKVGDFFEATYAEVESISAGKTTYYLKSSGYYEIHLDKSLPIQFVTLSNFITNPGYIIKYSNEKFREWKKLNN